MDGMPVWVLAANYWLHLLATLLWLGSLSALALVVLPAAARTLDLPQQTALMLAIQSRIESISWLCMFVLVATGMFQASSEPAFVGIVSTENAWSRWLLLKHILVALSLGLSVAMTWGTLPAVRRALLRLQRGGDEKELTALRRREALLLRLNLLLAALILAATAMAQAS
jgi:uncharacterized membrane protein